MAPPRKARQVDIESPIQPAVSIAFRIPCFAHQQLDPTRFPPGAASPIGRPISWSSADLRRGGGQGAWEDSDEQDDARDGDEDQVKTPKNKNKRTPAAKRKHESKPKPKPDDSYKRMKVPGGRPAIAKKVTADLDSDDDKIMRMKNAKFLEKDISQHLVNEGRIAYNPKTIGTRHARIMRAQQKRQDELLDAELTDWHDGDDNALDEAIFQADVEVNRMIEAANAKKWRIVADKLKQIKPVVNFSQNTCRNRYEALVAGTAKPTPESIPDPDESVQERIESRSQKEKRIEEDALLWKNANLEGNSWTSRAVKYF